MRWNDNFRSKHAVTQSHLMEFYCRYGRDECIDFLEEFFRLANDKNRMRTEYKSMTEKLRKSADRAKKPEPVKEDVKPALKLGNAKK